MTRDNKYDVSCEMVAQSNSRGGMIVVGIDDKTGRINPLSFVEVQETTNLLGSLASEGVVPQILLDSRMFRWRVVSLWWLPSNKEKTSLIVTAKE